MSITIYEAGNVDDPTESVPFTSREAARDFVVLEFEHVEETDTAELSFTFQPPEEEMLRNYFGSAAFPVTDYEFFVVTALHGDPKSWGQTTPEGLSWYHFVRTVTVYDTAEEAYEKELQ
ncbi:MAG TPA: hypothetical protein VGR71_16730 [Nitrospira sp.]|nr:hypothetical protein [Nitrospira sp.]